MKLYFDFYNDKGETKYIYLNDINNHLNINLDKFKLNAYVDDIGIDYSNITDFFLVIEKNVNGTYVVEKKVNGEYNSGILTYDSKFDDIISSSASYRLYFQFNEGGIIVYNGKDKPFYINLKTKCEEFQMEIFNSIMIEDYYEIQEIDSELATVTFKMSIINNKNFNNYRYYYVFSNKENIKDSGFEYKVLTENEVTITEPISINSFEKGVTYLHFYLKDTFENVSHRVFKITTKQNTLTLFEILNKEVSIVSDEEFGIFYNSRNIKTITPIVITLDGKGNEVKTVSKKSIGLMNEEKNLLLFKLSNYFDESFENSNVRLYFMLNEEEKNISNEMLILIDSISPEISINNFDNNNYKLITNNDNMVTVIGKIKDKNFFYLGDNRQKISLENAKHYLVIHNENEDIASVSFDNGVKKIEPLKYSNFYIVETLGDTFEAFNKTGEKIEKESYTYINDFVNSNSKNVYITFAENELTQYELNIIHNQGGLKVKGTKLLPFVKKQTFNKFANIYYLKIEIDSSSVADYEFDVGVADFGYSFLPKINFSNISCKLTNKKELKTDFSYTNIIVIKSNKDVSITKFNDTKTDYTYLTKTSGELTFCAASLKEGEYISPVEESMFFDDVLNSFAYEKIYSKPVVKDEKQHPIECLNYKLSELDDDIYSFSFDVKIENGINNNTLEYSDIIGNKSSVKFIVEKNNKPIEIEIDELFNKSFNKFKVDDKNYELTTNKKTINVKFVIKNETLNNIKSDVFLIIKSNDSYKKQKILTEGNQRVVYVEFSNLTDEKIDYKVYYNNEVKETINFSLVNIQSLTLNCVSEFISGFNYYYLKYDLDSFANLKLQYDSKRFNCKVRDNNIIEVTRNNYLDFLEKIDLELIATDKYNLYLPVVKKVHGIFYNSNIVQDYKIDDLHNNKILTPQFDLKIKTLHRDNIESITYYDPLEIDIFKRNKTAVYDSKNGLYIIKNIISPIIPSYLEISVKIKNENLIIKKRLFEENQISLYEEKNDISIVYIKEPDRIHIRLINKDKTNVIFSKLEIFNNGNFVKEINNIEFTEKNNIKDYYIDNIEFDNISDITSKLLNQFGKIILVYSELVSFTTSSDSLAYLKEFDLYNVLRKKSLEKIELVTEFDSGEYELIVTEILGDKKSFELYKGINSISLNDGQYLFELYYKKDNFIKKMDSYNVEIIKDDFEYLNYSKEYSKYLKINEIYFRKELNTNFKYLKPQIFHYHNDELVKVYEPDYIDNSIVFTISKFVGINKYIYNDKISSIELLPYNKTINNQPNLFNIYAIHTDDKSLFFEPNKNTIVLDKAEDIYFKTSNADHMVIHTKKVRSSIPRDLIDGLEVTLFKEFIPCKLEFYNLGELYSTVDIKVQKDEKITIPFFNKPISIKEVSYPVFIRNDAFKTRKSTTYLFIKNKQKHFLYSFVKNISILSGYKYFLNMNVDDQNKFIENLCIEYYKEFRNNNVEELKKYIKIKLEENNGNKY